MGVGYEYIRNKNLKKLGVVLSYVFTYEAAKAAKGRGRDQGRHVPPYEYCKLTPVRRIYVLTLQKAPWRPEYQLL